ncbi:unnamed protein product, partial [Aureobasidium vineae]
LLTSPLNKMRAFSGMAMASVLMAKAASAYNGTVKTVTVTSWSTVDLCPLPTTVTLCDPQCATPTSTTSGNIVYQTSSACQAGQTGVTTVTGDGVILTNCPCTAQSTILEITANGAGALPTALTPSTNYIVQIVYVYVVEYVVEQIPTAITSTVTSTLTTIQTETGAATSISGAIRPETSTASTTTTTPRPTIVTVDSVTFLLEYDTSYDGSALNGLRKRQASSLPGIAADLSACLSQCAGQETCIATLFDESTSLCNTLTQFNAQSRKDAPGDIFAIVIFRPTVSSSSSAATSSSASTKSSALIRSSSTTMLSGSVEPSGSTRSSVSTSLSSSANEGASTTSSESTTGTMVSEPGTTSIGSSSESSSRSSSRSVLYPISNSSSTLTTSSLSSRLSSSASASTTLPPSSFPTSSRSSSLSRSSGVSMIVPDVNSSTSTTSPTNTTSSAQVSVALPTHSS